MIGREPDYNKFNPQPKKEKVDKVYKGINKMSDKAKAKKDEKRQYAIELDKACRAWYDNHPTKTCCECGCKILFYTKMNCNHLVKKKDAHKYNVDIVLDTNNMALTCFTCHSKAETNLYYAPETAKLIEEAYKYFEKYLI